MRDFTAILGSTVFGGFTAATVASLLGKSSGDATNAVVLAAGAGVGLGFLLTALRKHDGER